MEVREIKALFDKSPDDVVELFRRLGVGVSVNLLEEYENVRRFIFTIVKVYNADILRDTKDLLERAMSEGMSYKDFQKNARWLFATKGYLPTKGDKSAYRWDTIYRTNLKSIFELGRQIKLQAIAPIYPYRRFVAVEDDRTTQICQDLDGAVARYDSPLYLNNQTPRHFNCRSTWIIERNPKPEEIAKWEDKKMRADEGFGVMRGDLVERFLEQAKGRLESDVFSKIKEELPPKLEKDEETKLKMLREIGEKIFQGEGKKILDIILEEFASGQNVDRIEIAFDKNQQAFEKWLRKFREFEKVGIFEGGVRAIKQWLEKYKSENLGTGVVPDGVYVRKNGDTQNINLILQIQNKIKVITLAWY